MTQKQKVLEILIWIAAVLAIFLGAVFAYAPPACVIARRRRSTLRLQPTRTSGKDDHAEDGAELQPQEAKVTPLPLPPLPLPLRLPLPLPPNLSLPLTPYP